MPRQPTNPIRFIGNTSRGFRTAVGRRVRIPRTQADSFYRRYRADRTAPAATKTRTLSTERKPRDVVYFEVRPARGSSMMRRFGLSAALLTALVSLPFAALAMAPGMPPEVASAIENCAEARQARTQETKRQAAAYCGEAMESLRGMPGEHVMLEAMAATKPDGEDWPWHHPKVLAEHGGATQDRKRFREAWRQATADADEMLKAHQGRTAADSTASTSGTTNTAAKQCDTQACFVQAVEQCGSASYRGAQAAGARARYAVVGPGDDGSCRVSFTYTANPNPELVDKPLTFVLDPEQPVEPQLKAGVSSCLTDKSDDFQCSGPLYEAVTGKGSRRER